MINALKSTRENVGVRSKVTIAIFFSADKAAVPMFVAPSVTPWRFKLPDGRVGPPHDPSVRLVYYDTTTGKHLDVVQFRLNLTDANAQSPLTSGGNFTQLYKFTEVTHLSTPNRGK